MVVGKAQSEKYSVFNPQTVKDEHVLRAIRVASKFRNPKRRFKKFKQVYGFGYVFNNTIEVTRLVKWFRRWHRDREDGDGVS